MKQNIIIVLLTAICCFLGWFAAQFHESHQIQASVERAESVKEVQEQMDEVVNGGIHNLKNRFTYDLGPDGSKKEKPFEKGTFQVLAIVDKDSKVIDVSIINPSEEDILNTMTITQINQLSIPPKNINGKPAKTRYLIPVNYEAYY